MQPTTQTAEQRIAGHAFFEGINPALLRILHEVSMYECYDAKHTIINEGEDADRFFLIHKGTVSLQGYVPGRGCVTVQILGAGEAFGCSWLYPPHRWRFTAQPHETTEVTAFHVRELRDRMKQNADLRYELVYRTGLLAWRRLQSVRTLLADYYGITE